MASENLAPVAEIENGQTYNISEIESACLQCFKSGMTRLLPINIPFFRTVVVSSFHCGHCGHNNRSLIDAGGYQDEGVRYILQVEKMQDLNRQVVLTNHATIKIPSLQFEMTCKDDTNSGVSVLEGVLRQIVTNMQLHVESPENDAESVGKLQDFIILLNEHIDVKLSYTIIIEDITGLSFLQNLRAPDRDPQLTVQHFARSVEQERFLSGQGPVDEQIDEANRQTAPSADAVTESDADVNEKFNPQNEVLTFPTLCYNCSRACNTHMKEVDIPHFKKVIVMSTACDKCGYRCNEVKPSEGIAPKGLRMDLSIEKLEDLDRDVIRSSTCSLEIPELEFEMAPSAQYARYSNVEGVITGIQDQLKDDNPFASGDSSQPEMREKLTAFLDVLASVVALKKPVHLILDDPAGNSYIKPLTEVAKDDPRLKSTEYERNHEHNEELGLNDMKTENY